MSNILDSLEMMEFIANLGELEPQLNVGFVVEEGAGLGLKGIGLSDAVMHELCVIVITVTLAITDNHRYLSDCRS
jgi:hypothetical protein